MASEKYILVRPPQLPELANIQAGAYVVGYNTATDQTVKINVSALGGGQETDISWRANITYATGNIVEYGLKLWKSLIDDNLGNFPTEGANWTEVSKAGAGSNITNYTPGVYTYDPTIVLRGGRIYYLLAEKPFESTNFIAELEANQWTAVNRNNLIGVDTQGNDYFFPFLGDTVIVLYPTSIGIENGEETVFSLTITEPSYVIRTGTGYTAGDFTILPIGGGGHTFEDQSGTALPARNVAKAGAGIEFEDDAVGEMTVVKTTNAAALPNIESASGATQPTINSQINARLFEQIAFTLSGYDEDVTTSSQDVLKSLPYAFKAYEIRAEFATAPTGSSAIVTFYKNGVSIGAVTVNDSAFSGAAVLAPAVVFAKGDSLSAIVTQVGLTIPGATAKAYIQGIKYQ